MIKDNDKIWINETTGEEFTQKEIELDLKESIKELVEAGLLISGELKDGIITAHLSELGMAYAKKQKKEI
jgi:hypothetical protein